MKTTENRIYKEAILNRSEHAAVFVFLEVVS